MENKEKNLGSVVHRYSEKDDRWCYIEYDVDAKIVGLNFMQGSNNQRDYDFFKESWCESDVSLTNFYDSMLYTFPIEKASVDKFTFINKCMWAYFSAQDKSNWWPEGEVAAAKLSADITFTGSMGAD